MYSSCVSHPANDKLIIIRESYVNALGDPKLAILVNFFEHWHNYKLANREQIQKIENKQQTFDGETDEIPEFPFKSLLQWHTYEEIYQATFGLIGIRNLPVYIKKLEELGIISIHKNPNPKYAYDRTNFYLFHPEKLQQLLDQDNPSTQIAHLENDKMRSESPQNAVNNNIDNYIGNFKNIYTENDKELSNIDDINNPDMDIREKILRLGSLYWSRILRNFEIQELEKLIQEHGFDKVHEAFKETCLRNKSNVHYLKQIVINPFPPQQFSNAQSKGRKLSAAKKILLKLRQQQAQEVAK